MLSIIKTAIITITLSFISGVLLDHYKNIAPRIICKIGKGRKVRLNNKEMTMYNLIIKNSSKQTIHNLNVNLHVYENELEIKDTEITRGLKFNISNEEGGCNINVPFLSKNDELKVKIFTEALKGSENKPIVTLRSPEKFKRIDSKLSNNNNVKSNHVKKEKTKGSNKFIEVFGRIAGSKKAVVSILLALCLLFVGVLFKEHIDKTKDVNTGVYTNTSKNNLDNGSKNKENNNNYTKNNNSESTNNKHDNSINNSYSSGSQSSNNKSEDSNGTSNSNGNSSNSSKENSTNSNNESNSENTINESGDSASNNDDNLSDSQDSSSSSSTDSNDNASGDNNQ